jgi:hypothetical protein
MGVNSVAGTERAVAKDMWYKADLGILEEALSFRIRETKGR